MYIVFTVKAGKVTLVDSGSRRSQLVGACKRGEYLTGGAEYSEVWGKSEGKICRKTAGASKPAAATEEPAKKKRGRPKKTESDS